MTMPCPCCSLDLTPAIPGRRRHARSLARKTADSVGRAIIDVLENEELATRPGLLQQLDPRVRLLTLLLFAVTASLVHSVWVLMGLVLATAALAAASKVGVVPFARRVWTSAGLLVIFLALPSATKVITPGVVVVPLGPLSLTQPGLMGAATLIARVVSAAGFSLLVIWTMRWADLLHALTRLGVPDVITATFALAHKQIVTLLRTVEQVHLAREARTLTTGIAADNRAWVTERMAFVVRKSMKTADDVYDAMLSRGFTGSARSLVRLRLRVRDWTWTAFCIGGCALVVTLDRTITTL